MVRRPPPPAPAPAPILAPPWLAMLQGASAALDAIERPSATLRADEPAHTTAATAGASSVRNEHAEGAGVHDDVIVRPGWGAMPSHGAPGLASPFRELGPRRAGAPLRG